MLVGYLFNARFVWVIQWPRFNVFGYQSTADLRNLFPMLKNT